MVHESLRLFSVGMQIRKLSDGIKVELPCAKASHTDGGRSVNSKTGAQEREGENQKYHIPKNDLIVVLSNIIHQHEGNGFGDNPQNFDEVWENSSFFFFFKPKRIDT